MALSIRRVSDSFIQVGIWHVCAGLCQWDVFKACRTFMSERLLNINYTQC